MLTRWFRIFGAGRGAPPRRRPLLTLLAVLAIGQGGCTTLGIGGGGGGGCNECGGFGSRIRAARDSIRCNSCGLFRHKRFGGGGGGAVMGDACEPGLIGVPAEVGPGAVIPAPGTAIPGPPAAGFEEMPMLKPAVPAETPEGSPPTGRATDGPAQAKYEQAGPRVGLSGSRREPAARPAPTPAANSSVDQVFSDLPPLTATVGGTPATPSGPPEGADALAGIEAPAPAAPADLPPQPAGGGPGMAPGIPRFKIVGPFLAGGSLPSAGGWKWLAEDGFKTVIDLRQRAEVQPADTAAIDHVGLIHVALPIAPETLDRRHLDQFRKILELSGGRNVYFFDTDGARAAALWFVHRAASGQLEPAAAEAEVVEMGPKDPRYWSAAQALLAQLRPAPPKLDPAPPSAPAADLSSPAPSPAAAVTPPPVPTIEPVAASNPPAVPAPSPLPTTASSEPAPPATPSSWKPYAAVILTGLSVPLAYFGRSALSFGAAIRASLPGPLRQPKPLPPASGE